MTAEEKMEYKRAVGERIKTLRTDLDMTQDKLAVLVGYKSRSSIQKIECGVRDLTRSQIVKFSNALHTTPAYLMGWTDEARRPENAPPFREDTSANLRALPAFQEVPVAGGSPAVQEAAMLPATYEGDYAVVMSDDSMKGAGIKSGDMVFIKTGSDMENGSLVALSMGEGLAYTVRRFYQNPETGQVILTTENPEFAPVSVELSTVRILGRVSCFISRV